MADNMKLDNALPTDADVSFIISASKCQHDGKMKCAT